MTYLTMLPCQTIMTSMADPPVLPTQDFTWVKAHLSDVMTSVVALHQPQQVVRHGREAMVLLNREDLSAALQHFSFTTSAVLGDGEVTVEVEEVGILGFGESLDAALGDAVEELRLYAQRFFANAAFYMASDRRAHAPWLMRFALTPPERHRSLLEEAPRPPGPERIALPA